MSNLNSDLINEQLNYDNQPDMYGYIDKHKLKNNKPNTITIKMIMDRNLKKTAKSITDSGSAKTIEEETNGNPPKNENVQEDIAEMKANQLLKLKRVHLDREKIGEIDNLAEYLGDVTHLYLQHNLIEKIENLEFLSKLKFISLANNRIACLENLHMLKNLKFLDLSENLIPDIPNVNELPSNLVSLDLRDNPCVANQEIWCAILENLKGFIKNLNGEFLRESEEDNEENESKNGNDESESFVTMREKVLERSKLRQKSDVSYLENISKERKVLLEEARRSITANFNS